MTIVYHMNGTTVTERFTALTETLDGEGILILRKEEPNCLRIELSDVKFISLTKNPEDFANGSSANT